MWTLALLFPAEAEGVRVARSDGVAFGRDLPGIFVASGDAAAAAASPAAARTRRQATVADVRLWVVG